MESPVSFEALFILGAVVLLVGMLSMVVFFVLIHRTLPPERAPSLLRYFGFAGLCGLVAYLAGALLGIELGCAAVDAGNLCGVWGALGAGPLLAGVVLEAYGLWWWFRSRSR